MTVKELIEQLEQMPPDMKVAVERYDIAGDVCVGYAGYVDKVTTNIERWFDKPYEEEVVLIG